MSEKPNRKPWEIIEDLCALIEYGMEADAFLLFIGSNYDSLKEWAKDYEPDAYKGAFK